MPIEIIVPRLGWSMNEGTFAGWLKNDGDVVHQGEMLFTLESDKATQDVETFDAGILRLPPDAPQPGDAVTVGQVIGYLCAENETAPPSLPACAPTGESAPTPAPQHCDDYIAGPAVRRLAREEGIDLTKVSGSGPKGRITRSDVEKAATRTCETADAQFAGPPRPASNGSNGNRQHMRVSPRAARKAAELGVDLAHIQGTGRGGRIRERDVLAVAQRPAADASTTDRVTATSTGKLRHVVADRVLAASQQTAPVTLTSRVDVTNLVALRAQFQQAQSAGSVAPSYSDLFIKLSAIALLRHPEIRCQWTDQGIVLPAGIHISVAVDTPEGLVVPVLRDADQLTLSEVAQRMRDLIDRTRSRQVTPDELQGGVFTISNLGNYHIDAFTPVLNMPQAAILGIGRIRQEPTVHEGQITVREMITLSLTFDHRVLDGAPAARFLDTLVQLVTLPAPSLIG